MGRDVSPDPNLVSAYDVAALTGISYDAVARLARELERKGEISPVRSRSRQRWFSRAEIEAIRKAWKARPKDRPGRGDPGDRVRMHSEAMALSESLTAMYKSCKAMAERARRLKNLLSVTASSTWKIAALPASDLRVTRDIPVVVVADAGGFTASAADLGLDAFGHIQTEAVRALRTTIAKNYFHLRNKKREPKEEELWSELRRFVSETKRAK